MTIDKDDTFEQFLARFAPELTTTADRYRRLRAIVIKFFKWNRCEDSEDLADETIGRLVKNLYAGDQIGRESSYVYAIAKNVFREYVRKKAKQSRLESGLELDEEMPEADFSINPECAQLCLEKLPEVDRAVLEQYYSEGESREELARRLGLSIAGLRSKIFRLKSQMNKCYKKCIMGSS